MSRHTSLDELYNTYGTLVLQATGRQWWRKKNIQARPKLPYATLYFQQLEGYEKPVVENFILSPLAEDGERFEQVPWCTSQLILEVEFFGDRTNDTSDQAAHRLFSALFLEQRCWDILLISGLAGRVITQDLSLVFREDVESRVLVRIPLVANVVDPLPFDSKIFDISHQDITITHVGIDDVETEIVLETINDDEGDSS